MDMDDIIQKKSTRQSGDGSNDGPSTSKRKRLGSYFRRLRRQRQRRRSSQDDEVGDDNTDNEGADDNIGGAQDNQPTTTTNAEGEQEQDGRTNHNNDGSGIDGLELYEASCHTLSSITVAGAFNVPGRNARMNQRGELIDDDDDEEDNLRDSSDHEFAGGVSLPPLDDFSATPTTTTTGGSREVGSSTRGSTGNINNTDDRSVVVAQVIDETQLEEEILARNHRRLSQQILDGIAIHATQVVPIVRDDDDEEQQQQQAIMRFGSNTTTRTTTTEDSSGGFGGGSTSLGKQASNIIFLQRKRDVLRFVIGAIVVLASIILLILLVVVVKQTQSGNVGNDTDDELEELSLFQSRYDILSSFLLSSAYYQVGNDGIVHDLFKNKLTPQYKAIQYIIHHDYGNYFPFMNNNETTATIDDGSTTITMKEENHDSKKDLRRLLLLERYAITVSYFSLGGYPSFALDSEDEEEDDDIVDPDEFFTHSNITSTWKNDYDFLDTATSVCDWPKYLATVLENSSKDYRTFDSVLTDNGPKYNGIYCDIYGHVTRIIMNDNNLIGTIPEEIGLLGSLQTLSLKSNQLSGSIPTSIATLSQLSSLTLSNNDLSGTIPSLYTKTITTTNQVDDDVELELHQVRVLDLSSNMLTGTIPQTLTQTTTMTTLSLSHNLLTGTIPTINNFVLQYHQQDDITAAAEAASTTTNNNTTEVGINQDGNPLLPPDDYILKDYEVESFIRGREQEISSTSSKLFFVNFDDNLLQGNLNTLLLGVDDDDDDESTSTTASSTTSKRPASSDLISLSLSNNMITGTIPIEIGTLLGRMLHILTIDSNLISGTLPTQIGNLNQLTLFNVSNNELSGILPTEIAKLRNVQDFSIAHNNFIGSIPTHFGPHSNSEIFRHSSYYYDFHDNVGLNGTMAVGVCPPSTSNTSDNGSSIDMVFSRVTADCNNVDCPCCTMCCKSVSGGGSSTSPGSTTTATAATDSVSVCEGNIKQHCIGLKERREERYYPYLNTTCDCIDNDTTLICHDNDTPSCKHSNMVCNEDDTVCITKGEYGYSHLDRDFITNHNWNYHCMMNYYIPPLPSKSTSSSSTSLSISLLNNTVLLWNETSTVPFEDNNCFLSIDGVVCNTCMFNNKCFNGRQEGLFIDCSNINTAAIYNECDPYLNGDNTFLQIFQPNYFVASVSSSSSSTTTCGGQQRGGLCMNLPRRPS